MPDPTIGAYEGRSHPWSNQTSVILPAMVRSVTPGLVSRIIARCAAFDAAPAFFSSSISPSSFTTRDCMTGPVTSCVGRAASMPSVTALKATSDLACSDVGCVQMFEASRRLVTTALFNSAVSSVIGSTASTPVACATPGVDASIFAPVYFSVRRFRVGRNKISL